MSRGQVLQISALRIVGRGELGTYECTTQACIACFKAVGRHGLCQACTVAESHEHCLQGCPCPRQDQTGGAGGIDRPFKEGENAQRELLLMKSQLLTPSHAKLAHLLFTEVQRLC